MLPVSFSPQPKHSRGSVKTNFFLLGTPAKDWEHHIVLISFAVEAYKHYISKNLQPILLRKMTSLSSPEILVQCTQGKKS